MAIQTFPRACPAALMLTRGRPWRVPPRLGAAVDVSDHAPGDFPVDVVQAAHYFSWGCQGTLEVFSAVPQASAESLDRLEKLCTNTGVGPVARQLLAGPAEEVLPPFVAQENFDAVVLGALTQRPERRGLVGTLTAALLESLECDFVLIKPATYRCPIPLGEPPRGLGARQADDKARTMRAALR